MPQQRHGLDELLTQSDAEREAHEAEQESIAWIRGSPITEADEFEDVEDDHDNAPPMNPGALRPFGGQLHEQQKDNADGGREQSDEQEMKRLRMALRRQNQ